MPASLNVPANGPTVAMIGVASGDRKEDWKSDSSTIFHMTHTRTGMITNKKPPAGTNVEVANGTILPVDGYGIIEVNLNQPGTTTKQVKMVAVAYMPGRSRTCAPSVKQWSIGVNHSSTTKQKLL